MASDESESDDEDDDSTFFLDFLTSLTGSAFLTSFLDFLTGTGVSDDESESEELLDTTGFFVF